MRDRHINSGHQKDHQKSLVSDIKKHEKKPQTNTNFFEQDEERVNRERRTVKQLFSHFTAVNLVVETLEVVMLLCSLC